MAGALFSPASSRSLRTYHILAYTETTKPIHSTDDLSDCGTLGGDLEMHATAEATTLRHSNIDGLEIEYPQPSSQPSPMQQI